MLTPPSDWLRICSNVLVVLLAVLVVLSLAGRQVEASRLLAGGDAAELSLIELLRLGQGRAGQRQQGRDGAEQGSHRVPPRVDIG